MQLSSNKTWLYLTWQGLIVYDHESKYSRVEFREGKESLHGVGHCYELKENTSSYEFKSTILLACWLKL